MTKDKIDMVAFSVKYCKIKANNDELYNLKKEVSYKSQKLSYDIQEAMFLVELSNIMSKME